MSIGTSTLGHLDVTHILFGASLDLIVIGGLILVAFFAVLRSGTGQATALALAFPFAALLYSEVPGTYLLGPTLEKISMQGTQAAVFGILFVVSLFLLYRIASCYDSLTGGSVIGVLAGFSVAILLIVTWLQIPALSALHELTPPLPQIFAASYRLYWTLGALMLLAFVRS
jgi:hypothetical protein